MERRHEAERISQDQSSRRLINVRLLSHSQEIDLFRRLKRLARRTGRAILILRRHPIVTSGRKARLYAPREAFTFMIKTVVQRGRTLRSAKECYQWYDGRR